MKILVLNCGSSSIKYQIFDMTQKSVLAKGIVEKIGLRGSFLKNERHDGDKVKLEGEILDHQAGIEYILGLMISPKRGCLKSLNEIDAVGHRVVHGGEKFKSSVLINQEVINELKRCIDLAPLHNPPNLKGIYAMQQLLPDVPQVGVFDTAFHQTMPPAAYMYALPYSLYERYAIRRYGFHGTSHRYISKRSCEFLDKDISKQKIVTAHLGNGASMAAVKHGASIDTSMGMTPVEGLIMGTRCGDVDPAVLTYLMDKESISVSTTNTLINKHSGVYGVSGVSSDMRDLEDAAWKNNHERADLALNMYFYRVKKYIGAYAAAMGGIDVLIFAGGIGENGWETREFICEGLEFLGIDFDKEKNKGLRCKKEEIISKEASKVTVLVVPTNEELVIAEDTLEIVKKDAK